MLQCKKNELYSGGQFGPALGVIFATARGGQFKPAWGGQLVRFFQLFNINGEIENGAFILIVKRILKQLCALC
jgi:hypothetical protein